MTAPKPRNWVPFPLVTPRSAPNAVSIDPRPAESAAKQARIKGKGCGPVRADLKAVVR